MKRCDAMPYKKLSGALNFGRSYSSSIQHNGIGFKRGVSENDVPSFSSCYRPFHCLRHCFFRSYSSEVLASRQRVKQPTERASFKEVKFTLAYNLDTDTETVKGVYDKMLNSISEKKTAPPNAGLWALVVKCSTVEDVELLFDMLQKLRCFRLHKLRIHENFNTALCQEVTKACVRAGAITYGMKALSEHNYYGLTPDIGSAHHLLLDAKEHNDVNRLVKIMKCVKENGLPLQPGTADIVFSICYKADRWFLMSKYGKRFVMSGVNLRQAAFDMWMDLAARRGDTDSLWKIERWRSESMKHYSLSTGFACAKTLSDARRPSIVSKLQKLASEWPAEVIRHRKENSEAFAANLQNSITGLLNALPTLVTDTKISV